MSEKTRVNRRTMLKAAGTLAGATVIGTAATARAEDKAKSKPGISFKNESFYDADGKFDVEKGKDGIIALCKYHGYPIYPDMRENLWVSDYNTGQFTKLGLAAYMFINNEEDRYMLMDLFLLPGQMLPEHWHLAGEKNPPKREGWLVRWGSSH
ncbi:MAG: hypothetical protein HQ567_03355, partial [Candidatus Nealsonbacteria bacterium]|nr:hypothetical protein [Candidatus Nealsonbacteria bacterium]